LSHIEDGQHRFETFNDVFLLSRARTHGQDKTQSLRMEFVKKQKVDEESNADTWTLSMKGREMNGRRNYIHHEIAVSKELFADFNFVKIH
jgi:hypothetical protein